MMYTNEEAFANGSKIARHHLKRKILEQNLLPYECAECEQGPEWNGKPLVLQLEHKNGVNRDNRLENLCFLCPNCHSQTETYAGRGSKGTRRTKEPRPCFKTMKRKRDLELWESIKGDASLGIGQWGWKARVARRVGISPQKTMLWIKRIDPEFRGMV